MQLSKIIVTRTYDGQQFHTLTTNLRCSERCFVGDAKFPVLPVSECWCSEHDYKNNLPGVYL